MYKTILGIETSCDETAAAVLKKDATGVKVLSNIIASSAPLQAKFGGVIPEQAAREQLKSIIPVVKEALTQAMKLSSYQAAAEEKDRSSIAQSLNRFIAEEIDAIAVTYGPGLIGSLLVGVETAKTLALVWGKPLIPINHLLGHFYANWINGPSAISNPPAGKAGQQSANSKKAESRRLTADSIPSFPIIGLLVSGGHTDLVLFTDHGKYKYLGGTRDDAAGECFDKCARLMGLPYPGGPEISKIARSGNPAKIKLPQPMIDSGDFDFSFSGLKTSVSNIVHSISETHSDKRLTLNDKQNLSASIEVAIVEVLVKKTLAAVKKYGLNQVMIAGGVAANSNLSVALRKSLHVRVFSPSHNIFCTDNAAMIAAAAFFAKQTINPLKLQANPNLSLL